MFLYPRIYWLADFGDVSCLQFNYLRVETILGTGLMEIVTEPDLSNGMGAAAFVKKLQLILERINTCNCKMEGTGYARDSR
jgi:Asp-tRNA(Asn)/Glu-tRNA(Gln) amidotransferase B subunit